MQQGRAHISEERLQNRPAIGVTREAVISLTRPGHDNENFSPAMREFGLLG